MRGGKGRGRGEGKENRDKEKQTERRRWVETDRQEVLSEIEAQGEEGRKEMFYLTTH